jgi:alpha-L-rhamnosidase
VIENGAAGTSPARHQDITTSTPATMGTRMSSTTSAPGLTAAILTAANSPAATSPADETSLPQPLHVRLEHHEEGRLGIGESRPRLSWRYERAAAGFQQTCVEVEITISSPGHAAEVSTHQLLGAEQVLVPWPGRDLRSRERVQVRVRSSTPHGASTGHDPSTGAGRSAWSPAVSAEVGLLHRTDWQARFVGPPEDGKPDVDLRPARLRAEFETPQDVVSARLYLSAHGLVQAEVNGRRVGDEELTPGWTSYHHRLRYATFDLDELIVPGRNAIGLWLADGWWRGRVGFEGGSRNVYGHDLSALAQLEMTCANGRRVIVATGAPWTTGADDYAEAPRTNDASDVVWTVHDGPILATSLYDGEHADTRLHDPQWSRPGWNDPDQRAVRLVGPPTAALVAPTGPPVRCTKELSPVSIQQRGPGRWLLDFGQNHSGRLCVRGHAPAGTSIVLRHAELVEDGELYTRTLRHAAATDRLDLPGGDFEWEPMFTIHGYRYAEVSGWPGELRPGDVVSRVLHTDLERTGWFESSHPGVNRLHENVLWSMRSNFVDIPADCPQRDERLGWTGDLQVFAPTAAFLYSVTGMLSSWLEDLAVEQAERGTVPFYVPYLPLGSWQYAPIEPSAVWGDVAVLTPDVLHQRSGDVELLRRQYASAKHWLDQVHTFAGKDLLCADTFQLGDWLDPAAPPDEPERATTDPYLVATAYFAHSAQRLAHLAETIGEVEDARQYGQLAAAVRAAYARAYLSEDGRSSDDTQTAYALATAFDLWPSATAQDAGTSRLAELVRAAAGRIATGFAGTPLITDALTRGGHEEEAYRLLLSEECPSWLYMVSMGATTIWERWDSMLPDATVNPGDMTSFNHYALGSVGDWLHRVVAGLAPDAPGYRRIRFAPRPGGGLTWARARHLTPYGEASIAWRIEKDMLHLECTVPVGTVAVLDLAGSEPVRLDHGRHHCNVPWVADLAADDKQVVPS